MHNCLCSALSLYSLVKFLIGLWEEGDPLSMRHHSEGSLHHAMLTYWVSKYVELLDTVYMILRHKKRQISFLHVWHHSSITLLADWGYHYLTKAAFANILALNAAIHVVMYGYYALSAANPLREFAWKKHITQMQMTQFVIGVVYAIYGYLKLGFCVYSIFYGALMLAFFSNYYYHAFVASRPSKQDKVCKENGLKPKVE